MTHTSGLKATNAEGAAAIRVKAGTLASASLNLSLTSTPGSTFDYESSILAMQLLVQVVERAVGERFTAFAEKYVLRPAGMANSVYKGDEPATNWDTGDPWLAGGLDTTCRDLARLGQLFQQKGQWAGRQIFTEEFATQATAVQMSNIVFPGGASGNYGFLLNHNWGGIGHAGACGQLVITMPSGITVSSMSSSSLLTPTTLPSECSLLRVGQLINATLAVARLNF
jgi:CubicO group peptidase (beta-lactamase class C family)